MKKCPLCAEEIQDEAVKCRYCGEFLDGQRTHRREKHKSKPQTRSTPAKVGCAWLVASLFLAILIPSLLTNYDQSTGVAAPTRAPRTDVGPTRDGPNHTDFRLAVRGEYWRIEEDDIPVFRDRETPANQAQFLRNLVTVIGSGTRVEVLDSKGILSPWILVNVYDEKGAICANGWILAETVKKARCTQRGLFSP